MAWKDTLSRFFTLLAQAAGRASATAVHAGGALGHTSVATIRAAMTILGRLTLLVGAAYLLAIVLGVILDLSWLIATGTLLLALYLTVLRWIIAKALALVSRLEQVLGPVDPETVNRRLKFGIGTILGIALFGLILNFHPSWSTFIHLPVVLLFMFALNLFDKLGETRKTEQWRKRFARATSLGLSLFLLLVLISWTLPQTNSALKEGWGRFDSWLRTSIVTFPNQIRGIISIEMPANATSSRQVQTGGLVVALEDIDSYSYREWFRNYERTKVTFMITNTLSQEEVYVSFGHAILYDARGNSYYSESHRMAGQAGRGSMYIPENVSVSLSVYFDKKIAKGPIQFIRLVLSNGNIEFRNVRFKK